MAEGVVADKAAPVRAVAGMTVPAARIAPGAVQTTGDVVRAMPIAEARTDRALRGVT
ncbi:MAG: hypothetical protein HY713_14840 [candidate division NC10 bacterium]|nr:hypothetical protein [candidate division NC10 bacterium]